MQRLENAFQDHICFNVSLKPGRARLYESNLCPGGCVVYAESGGNAKSPVAAALRAMQGLLSRSNVRVTYLLYIVPRIRREVQRERHI